MQLSLRLPADLMHFAGLGSPGRSAIHAIERALEEGTALCAPDGKARAAPVYLSTVNVARITALPERPDSLQRTAEALIYGWVVAQRKAGKIADNERIDLPVDMLRKEQVALISNLLPHLDAGHIAFAEASTGVGKSRAIAVLASKQHEAGKCVTVATPTIKLMTQLLQEFADLGMPAPAIHLGRRQFVNPALLEDALANTNIDLPQSQRASLEAWIAGEGKPVDGNESTVALAKHVPDVAWLIDDMTEIAPSLPASMVRADESDDDHPVYEQMRARWEQAPIRVASHALIAAHMRLASLGSPVIDNLDVLMVDEAHLLYDAIRQIYNGQLSLFSLRSRLSRVLKRQDATGCLPGLTKTSSARIKKDILAAQKCISEKINELSTMGVSGNLTLNVAGGKPAPDRFAAWIRSLADQLCAHLESIAKSKLTTCHAACMDGVEACRRIASSKPVGVKISPKRMYPSIYVGGKPPRKVLQDFWESVGAACLVSGTIYTDTAEHGISAALFCQQLQIPAMRVKETPRIVAPWIYTTPTIHVPQPKTAVKLKPQPNGHDAETNKAESAYYDNLARACLKAAHAAAGGTLILCTSYPAIEALERRLEKPLADRLIVQGQDLSFSALTERFRLMGAKARPVWLATGPAWTGLDLRERRNGKRVPSKDDRLLTDVVITRLPIMPQDFYSQSKQAAIRETRLETALRFRQGIGRLVRADGLPDRHLWVLDGRMWAGERNHMFVVAPSLRVLSRYPNVKQFRL